MKKMKISKKKKEIFCSTQTSSNTCPIIIIDHRKISMQPINYRIALDFMLLILVEIKLIWNKLFHKFHSRIFKFYIQLKIQL